MKWPTEGWRHASARFGWAVPGALLDSDGPPQFAARLTVHELTGINSKAAGLC
jgi:hypothetical protein